MDTTTENQDSGHNNIDVGYLVRLKYPYVTYYDGSRSWISENWAKYHYENQTVFKVIEISYFKPNDKAPEVAYVRLEKPNQDTPGWCSPYIHDLEVVFNAV